MEPQLARLYAEGSRSFEATVVSGQSFVRAGQQCRLRLPDGTQANFTAQTDINSGRVQVLITNQGAGLAWCLSAGQVMDSRLLDYRRERPLPSESVDLFLPVRAILQARTVSGIAQAFIGCDRPTPELLLSLPEGWSFTSLNIRSRGSGRDDWDAIAVAQNISIGERRFYFLSGQQEPAFIPVNQVSAVIDGVDNYGNFIVRRVETGIATSNTTQITAFVGGEISSQTSVIGRKTGDNVFIEDLHWRTPTEFNISTIEIASPTTTVARPRITGSLYNNKENAFLGQGLVSSVTIGSLGVIQRTNDGSIFSEDAYPDFSFNIGLPNASAGIAGRSVFFFGSISEPLFVPELLGSLGSTQRVAMALATFGDVVSTETFEAEYFGFEGFQNSQLDFIFVANASYFPP